MKLDWLAGMLFVVIGLWSICGAAFNLAIFIEHRKARSVVAVLNRTGTRVVFGLLGVGLVVLGSFCFR